MEVCPVNCIHPAPGEDGYATAEMLYIDPDVCIDCGACADVCPVGAISSDDELEGLDVRYLEVNAEHYARSPVTPPVPTEARSSRPIASIRPPEPVLRVAIIGSGPSACYAAEELLSNRDVAAEVTIIERLPFVGGLVRYGVAPDHSRTKSIDRSFERTLRRPGVTLHLGVEIGSDIGLDEVVAHHHAVIVAAGAADDRRMGIPGEDLPGVHSARDVVAWYNGHPDHAHRAPDLSGPRAMVLGNGNVALDVARMLISRPDDLRRTDMADHALEALEDSGIREVVLVGRRGAEFAACTTPELLGLKSLRGVDVVVADEVPVGQASPLKTRILAEFAAREPRHDRRIVFRFGASPSVVRGSDRATGVGFVSAGGNEPLEIDCGLVVRSIGYRGAAFDGLPFDDVTGTVSNEDGRVVAAPGGRRIPGLYTAGWLKRGPTGVIGTNRFCARETVSALIEDRRAGALPSPLGDASGFEELVRTRNPQSLDAEDWFAIDKYERFEGRRQGRPRVKVVDRADAVALARSR
ncbi:putative ferredoxin--NADP(+) reductase [Gordonia soli NBRC 108243]|uniref:ferredoxin--NADP(+) reductase n=1 Tax=Gordonia soli NBRC 108243 TaxID=1223545 RepID=M0QM69_9ACTN|nr:putative ferredoxin--NADP(+) reductase [Gordonia soli NBRC 108243]